MPRSWFGGEGAHGYDHVTDNLSHIQLENPEQWRKVIELAEQLARQLPKEFEASSLWAKQDLKTPKER